MTPALIYCANGNPRLATIAVEAGYRYGCQLPGSVMAGADLDFADQDWKRPDRAAYMAALSVHRPRVASVLDWERSDQLPEVLDWAEEAAQHVREGVIVIPKVPGEVDRIPRRVGGKAVILGYSVPTRYGSTPVPYWEFEGWPVHLLGGSPQQQMSEWMYLSCVSEVVTADGNMPEKVAVKWCQFWSPTVGGGGGYWRDLPEGEAPTDRVYEEAFRRSCRNVMAAWRSLSSREVQP